jgi:dienelactone hydrolase
VLEGVTGEGVFYMPKEPQAKATVILLLDPSQKAAPSATATLLCEAGCRVLVPTLVDRRATWSGSEALQRFTNVPHREWIYRQAFELGRTIIGYEVEKVLAAVHGLSALDLSPEGGSGPIIVAGYGEGGLIALAAAAVEPRLSAAIVSGYFGSHDALYREPIYRNVFGLLKDFGNAELAAMISPRPLVIDDSDAPKVAGPPKPEGKQAPSAAPGAIPNPEINEINAEIDRTRQILRIRADAGSIVLLPFQGLSDVKAPAKVKPFFEALGGVHDLAFGKPDREETAKASEAETERQLRAWIKELKISAADERQHRAVTELERFTQHLVRDEERGRNQQVWKDIKPGPAWDKTKADLKQRLWQSIGQLPDNYLPANPRTRRIIDQPKWTAYEVMLDVYPDVDAWGWLLIPKDLKPGERRPVVVCQHGLEGLPQDVVTEDPKDPSFHFYQGFAARLAEQGFITYAPHNPYRGKDKFREIQRRANPLGLSLFSFIIAQHDVTTQWLASLPFVDPERIAFYGLSYGGKSAMRIPAMLDRYCLSICSGDFNEWITKIVSTESRPSYMFSGEYEIFEWNLGNVANYAEMAMLISPRPFMVERGHDDGVALDEWVGYEYAKVLRGYAKLGIEDKTQIEWFNGPHMIHGVGTFEFLHKHLHWPQ